MPPLAPFLALALLAPLAASSPASAKRSAIAYTDITPATWRAFNKTIAGRLREGYPVARPCYRVAAPGTGGAYDEAKCGEVEGAYLTPGVIEYFGGYPTPNWATCQKTDQQCALDAASLRTPVPPTEVCYQGSVPTYYVNASQVSDVAASFAFAEENGIQLTIKNSGHDLKGRSSGPYTLGVWTHHIQYIERNDDFVAAGCGGNTSKVAITFGTGTDFDALYKFADENNLTFVGGSVATVKPGGGWVGGAGHSSLSNTLGLGVDRTLEMKVVTPDGKLRTASRCQNQDLFFALRGGGAGTYGVVVEATMEAAPRLTLQTVGIELGALSADALKGLLRVVIANQQRWANEGWGGDIILSKAGATGSVILLMTPKLDTASATASMKPLTDYVATLGNATMQSVVREYGSFYEIYEAVIVNATFYVGAGVAIGSRLVPDANFASNSSQSRLLDAVTKGVETTGAEILLVTPYNHPSDGTSGETPAWRKALWHVVFVAPWDIHNATEAEIVQAYDTSTKATDFVRAITPPGAYSNEASVHEPDYKESFWGEKNYERLAKIKQQYDPKNLLSCWQCVGWSEAEAASNPRYGCYV